MGFRFRKSLHAGPFRLNLSKSGLGWSWGIPGLRWTQRADHRQQVTFNLPGSGFSYVQTSTNRGVIDQKNPSAPLAPSFWKWMLIGLVIYVVAFLAFVLFPKHPIIFVLLAIVGTIYFVTFFVGTFIAWFSKSSSSGLGMGPSSPPALRSALGPAGVLLEELLIPLRKDWTKGVQFIQERIQDPQVLAWVAQDPGLLFLVGVTHPSAEQACKYMTRFRQIWPLVRVERQVLYQEVLRETLNFTIIPYLSLGRHMDLSPWVRYTYNLSIHDQSAKFFLGYCAYQLNHYQRAIQLLSGFAKSWLASPAQLLMANAHIQMDQIPQACACFRSLAEQETEKERKVAFSILEAYLRADQGDRRIALVIVQRYQRWQALSPNLKKILWYLLGLWLYEEKEFPRAQKWLERVVALDPNFEDCQEIMRNMASNRPGNYGTKFQQGQENQENSSDPYTVLGVSRKATKEEIRQAYRKAMSGYHPDKVAHLGPDLQALAAQRARSINQAYDSIKRERRG